jgi:hypothetical protein
LLEFGPGEVALPIAQQLVPKTRDPPHSPPASQARGTLQSAF